ncbi:MAG: methylated-DNA--[protein]-cysteine S-methyltransferase [Peptococcaceae bacterium]|nr:methylated-DNA--[protein]-cysteine S-methyltransferase [Peptococcaceae bacterium]
MRKPVPPNYAIIGFGQGHEEYLAELRNSLRHAGTVRLVPDHAANLQTIRQVLEYLDGRRRDFALRLRLFGTEFQQKVWRELLKIPYGVTISYGDIAYAVGNRKGARAVGMANNRNPVSLIVPCHRVIGKNGKLVGYGGGLDIKEKLLSLEKMNAEISVTCTG